MTTFTATYSPEDNKLRLYASSRLDAETYARIKSAGFSWAPKQDLFFAPMWTPAREDLLIELAGEVGDEDTSLADRAEQRAERFEDYHDSRTADAESARKGVAAIADNIPFGQPILVGHHSERHARKDAERIENGMRRAVKMWDTAQYWKDRAAGARCHADYKARPDVCARRIKGLEADARKLDKQTKEGELFARLWAKVETGEGFAKQNGAESTMMERALYVANHSRISRCFPLADYPRDPPASQYEGAMSLWSALDGGVITAAQAVELALRVHASGADHRARWSAHYANRLAYERAMLGESGYTPPPKAATVAALPLLNYNEEITYRNPYHRGETITVLPVAMTRAEYAAIYSDYRGTRVSEDGTHRVRVAYIATPGSSGRGLVAVFLTDSKAHAKPGTVADDETAARISKAQDKIERTNIARAAIVRRNADIIGARAAVRDNEGPSCQTSDDAQAAAFAKLREAAKAGVQVVAVPQLFITPKGLAQRVADLADVRPGDRVLEPSAGTGMLVGALGGRMFGHAPECGAVVAVEINQGLADRLQVEFPLTDVRCADFLSCNGDLGAFDRIVMNPPFVNGADIAHIQHARKMLAPGGRLVAICADGPRQRAALQPLAESWESLPAGTFADVGTMVSTALVVMVQS